MTLSCHGDLRHIVLLHIGYTVLRVEGNKQKSMATSCWRSGCYNEEAAATRAWNDPGASCIQWLRDAAR